VGLRDVGMQGLRDVGLRDVGMWDSRTSRLRDVGTCRNLRTCSRTLLTNIDFYAEFVKYNFWWLNER